VRPGGPATIYRYTDYRRFLRDRFLERKRSDRNFSYRKFALRAGLSSPNFLKLVIENKRNLSEEGIRKFAKGFGLNANEEEYFRNMVLMNQARTHEEKDCFYRRMIQCRGFARTRLLDKKEYEYYAAWYHPVVRELAAAAPPGVGPAWIAERIRPEVSEVQVKRSLRLLESLGMLRREGETWVQSEPIVSTGPEVSSILIAKYHKNMIRLGGEAIDRFPPQARDISSVTIRVPLRRLHEIKKAVQAFRKELLGLEMEGEGEESVMQVNIQIFPVSRAEEEKHDHR